VHASPWLGSHPTLHRGAQGGGAFHWAPPLLHKQALRDANSKAPKAQPPSPPCSVPCDHDGHRASSIPAMGSQSKTQNTALERLLPLEGMPRCCGRAAHSLHPPPPACPAGGPRAGHGVACPRAMLLRHGSCSAAGRGSSRQPAAGSSASHTPRLPPLQQPLLCRKAAGPRAWGLPGCSRAAAQGFGSDKPLCAGRARSRLPSAGEMHGRLRGSGAGAGSLCKALLLVIIEDPVSGLGLLVTETSTVLGTPGTASACFKAESYDEAAFFTLVSSSRRKV